MHATSARNKFVTDGVGSTPPEKLLVMLYDRLLRDLDEATAAIGRSEIAPAHEALAHAQDIVAELHSALDPGRWDGAEALGEVYTWLAEVLTRANIAKDAALVVEARSLVKPLRDTWSEAYAALCVAPLAVTAGGPGTVDLSG